MRSAWCKSILACTGRNRYEPTRSWRRFARSTVCLGPTAQKRSLKGSSTELLSQYSQAGDTHTHTHFEACLRVRLPHFLSIGPPCHGPFGLDCSVNQHVGRPRPALPTVVIRPAPPGSPVASTVFLVALAHSLHPCVHVVHRSILVVFSLVHLPESTFAAILFAWHRCARPVPVVKTACIEPLPTLSHSMKARWESFTSRCAKERRQLQ